MIYYVRNNVTVNSVRFTCITTLNPAVICIIHSNILLHSYITTCGMSFFVYMLISENRGICVLSSLSSNGIC